MKTIKLSQRNPIAALEDHILFSSDGSVVLCYQGFLPEIYSLSEKDYEDLHACWFQALKSLPVGTVVHKQDSYLKKEFSAGQLPNTSFLEKATHKYFKGRDYLSHSCYLFFILPPTKNRSYANYTNPFKKISKTLPVTLDEAVHSFKSAVEDAVSFINNTRKMVFKPLTPATVETLTTNYFNGFNENLTTDILLDKNRIQIGDHLFDALAINSELCFGESVQTSKTNQRFTSEDFIFHQGYIDGLGLALDENHIVNQILYLDDKHKWRKILDKKVEELSKSSNFGSQNKIVLGKIQHILNQINTDEGSRVIRGQLNVIYWTKEPKTLECITAKLKTEFKELDSLPYYPKGEALKQ